MSEDPPKRKSSVLFRPLPATLRMAPDEKRELREFARELNRTVAVGSSFTCVISDDRELQRLNREFLHHDYPTDVLSFPSLAGGDDLGDLIISLERAAAQARNFGHDRIWELRILMLHGLLHLCGMDHERDRGEMERTEQQWRRQLGLPAALIARTRSAQ